jgi:hypothetical protein
LPTRTAKHRYGSTPKSYFVIFVEVLTGDLVMIYEKISLLGKYSLHYSDGSGDIRCRFPVLPALFLGTADGQHRNCVGVPGILLTVPEIVAPIPDNLF